MERKKGIIEVRYMKKAISSVLCLVLLFCCSITVFAQEPATFSITTGNVENIVLLDEVYFAIDQEGNIQRINPNERNWFTDHVVMGFHFYDMGVRNLRHYYEVHMSAVSDDSAHYFTKHVMRIRPTGNTDWFKHTVTHNMIDHKLIIGDSMGFNYAAGSEPANPKVDVKCTFYVQGFGSYSLPQFTLSEPTSL